MSVFSAVKQLVLEYLGMYTPPVPSLCGRCGQPRSAACGDDFFSVINPLFPKLAGGPAVMVDWPALEKQFTTMTGWKSADPQPSILRDWSGSSPAHVSSKVVENQLRFLLSQAPMIDAPADLFNAGRAVTKFAYVHPKTFAAFTKGAYAPKSSAPYVQISPSRTKWVMTTLMPEKVVIYTSNPLPGIEKLLAS